jgi:hypothetical protein
MGALLTNYVYFTVAMYGFFSVGMVSDAKVFYGSESPLCYFTEFDVSGQWFAKMVGTIIFFLVMSPFYAGVSFETYARISLPMNLIQTPVFIKAAFLDTNTGPDGCNSPYAMPFSLWIPQVGLCFVLIVWNVMALNQDYSGAQEPGCKGATKITQAPKDGATHFIWAQAAVYAACFGSTLMIAPKWFWGPDSLFAYWEVNDDTGVFFGRLLGITMCCLYLSPLYSGLEYAKLAKIAMPVNCFALSYFAKCAFFIDKTGPGNNALLPVNLWVMQVPIGLGFLLWNVKVLRDTKGAALL